MMLNTCGFCAEESSAYTHTSLLKLIRTHGNLNNIVIQNEELGILLPNYKQNSNSDVSLTFYSIKQLLEMLQKMDNELKTTLCGQSGATSVTLSLGILNITWEKEKLCHK